MTLPQQIVALLRRVKGEKLTFRMIAGHLGIIMGNTGEAWQNACRMAFELAKLEEYKKIETDGRYNWIPPPRDPATGALLNP